MESREKDVSIIVESAASQSHVDGQKALSQDTSGQDRPVLVVPYLSYNHSLRFPKSMPRVVRVLKQDHGLHCTTKRANVHFASTLKVRITLCLTHQPPEPYLAKTASNQEPAAHAAPSAT